MNRIKIVLEDKDFVGQYAWELFKKNRTAVAVSLKKNTVVMILAGKFLNRQNKTFCSTIVIN